VLRKKPNVAYFRWNGLTNTGLEVNGIILASSQEAAQLILMYQNIAVLRLRPIRAQSRRTQQQFLRELIAKLAIFTHHGLPLHQALATVTNQTTAPYSKANIEALNQDVRSGQSLAESIREHFPYTSAYVVALIKSGEESNRTSQMLHMLSQYLNQQVVLRKKIFAAVTPPLLTLLFTSAIIIILLIGVVPQFEQLFSTLEKPIPAGTAALIGLAHKFSNPFFYCGMGLVIGGIYGLKLIVRLIPGLKQITDTVILHVPILGAIIIKLELGRFLGMIGILSDAALPLHNASQLAQTSASNAAIAAWLTDVTNELKHGRILIQAVATIPHPLKSELHDLLAPTLTLGIKQKTLALATESLEQDAFKSISRITAIIGPILLIMVGGVIFAILIFLYLPLFNLANSI
jgi:type II secretory pathway component PulF